MQQLSNEQVIDLIDNVVGDEFCADLDCRFNSGSYIHLTEERLLEMLKEASKKLTDVYMIAHSHNTSHSCYERHDIWRKQSFEKWEKLTKSPNSDKSTV